MSSKTEEIRISAKVLAALNMPEACPRCFWVEHHMKLPYQIFPGIFMSIDAYTKKAIHAYFDQNGVMPSWIPELSDVVGYLKVPHWSKFKRLDPVTGITLSGVMDDCFEMKDGSRSIPDYKTAKFTASQDKLLPIYFGQLNGYRWIEEGLGFKVSSMPLIYFEPVTDQESCIPEIFHPSGFHMKFSAKVMQVEKDDELIPTLLVKAAEIIYLDKPPAPVDDCEECNKIKDLLLTLGE